jgi:DNA polymerase-3 subunit gamma/tau
VVFVLATTDAQKVPITVLSRCLQFSLKNMPPATIAARLREVLAAEGIAFEPEALDEIGRAAAGSMRDALSLLDQAIAHGAGSVVAASVREMVGVADRAEVGALINALVAGEGPALMARAEAMVNQGVAPERTLEALAALVHRIALAQVGAVSPDDAMSAQVHAWAANIAPEDLQVWWQIAIQGGRDLPWAPDPASGLTMTLLRMLAFRPGQPAASRLSPPAPTQTPAPAALEVATAVEGPVAVEVPVAALDRVPAPATVPAEVAAIQTSAEFAGDWPALARVLTLSGIARQCVDRSALVSFDHDGFVLRAPIRAMTEAPLVAKIRDALTAHFGRPMRVSILSGDVEGPTVAGIDSAEQAQRLAQAQAVIQADPFVQALIQDFGAQIVPGSVQPTL